MTSRAGHAARHDIMEWDVPPIRNEAADIRRSLAAVLVVECIGPVNALQSLHSTNGVVMG